MCLQAGTVGWIENQGPTLISRGSLVALLAEGGLVKRAVDLLLSNQFCNGFLAIRPPCE